MATFLDSDRQPAVRTSDRDTCRAPDQSVMSAGRWAALHALWWHGPSTDFELAEHTGLVQTSVGKRRCDLLRAGLVEATTDRRPSPSGASATVWRLTDAGRAEFMRLDR